MFRLGPLLAIFFNDAAWRQTKELMPKQTQEVRRRLRKRYADRVVVNCLDANVLAAYGNKFLALQGCLQFRILCEQFIASFFVARQSKPGRRMHQLMKSRIGSRQLPLHPGPEVILVRLRLTHTLRLIGRLVVARSLSGRRGSATSFSSTNCFVFASLAKTALRL